MKKNHYFLSFWAFVLLNFILVACKKYDEGGPINKTEKNLATEWRLVEYLNNGTDKTSTLLITNYREAYSGNGVFSRSYTDKNGSPVTDDGRWLFKENEKTLSISDVGSIEITVESGTVSSSSFSILRLNKKEFWYYFINGNVRHEFRFVRN